jgi:hypothetical protein
LNPLYISKKGKSLCSHVITNNNLISKEKPFEEKNCAKMNKYALQCYNFKINFISINNLSKFVFIKIVDNKTTNKSINKKFIQSYKTFIRIKIIYF